MAVAAVAGLMSVGGAMAAAGTLAIGWSVAATAFAIGAGLSIVSRALMPKPELGASLTGLTSTVREPASTRKIVYGRSRVGGAIVFIHNSGEKNKNIHFVIAYAAHVIDAYEEIYLNDKLVWTAGGGIEMGWADYVRIDFYDGTQTTADANLVAESVKWTSDHKLLDNAYIHIRLTFDADKFPQGVPNVSAIIRGKKVYDPRQDSTSSYYDSGVGVDTQRVGDSSTWEWSQNPAICVLDYLTNSKYGLGEPHSNIDYDYIVAAADSCDTEITITDGTQTKFNLNGIVDTGETIKGNIEAMLASMGGRLVFSGGKYYLTAAEYQTPVDYVIDETDLVGQLQVNTKQSRRNLYNGVKGVFLSEEKNYILADYPAQLSSAYATIDGDPIYIDMPLPFVTNNIRAQRIAKIALLKSRQQTQISIPLNLAGLKYKAGDFIKVSNTRLGWTEKVFEVLDYSLQQTADGAYIVNLSAVETDSTVYDWTLSDEQVFLEGGELDLDDGRFVNAPVLTTSASRALQQDGTVASVIDATWTEPDNLVDYYVVTVTPAGGTPESINTQGNKLRYVVTDTTVEHTVTVKAVNYVGVSSSTQTSAESPIVDTTAPAVPANVSATGTLKQILLTWDNPGDADFKHVEIYRSDADVAPESETTPTFKNDGEELVDGGYTGEVTRYYWVRSVDTSGNKSAWVASGAATTVLAVTNDLGDDIVTADKIFANTITSSEIDADSVASAVITAGSIVVSGDNISGLNNDSGFNNTYVDGNGDIQGVSSGAGTSVDNTLNAGKTLALLLNQTVAGTANDGECAIVGVDNEGNIDRTADGYILWNGSKITVDRYQHGTSFTLLTHLANKRGFVCFDTTKSNPFTVATTACDIAFVYKQGSQWYYDNNGSTPAQFTPSNDLVALGWLETGTADLVVRGGLFGEPVSLTTASFPSDVIESGSVGGIKIEPTKLYEGTGTFNNANTGFYLDSSGQFSLKDKLSFDGSDLTVDGGIKATTLDVIDATVTGTLNASSVSDGSIKVESLSQGVWNAIDERFSSVSGSTGGFYETDNGVFVGSEITIATPQVAHNTKDIVFQIAIDQYWASTVNRVGTALQATLTFEYSTDNSNWNTVSSGGSNATTTLTATNFPFSYSGEENYIYYLVSGYQFTMAYAELAAGNYYFRVRITPVATTNAFQLSNYLSTGGIPVTYEANEAVSGTVSTSGNANTLDSLDSTQFLRSDEDDSTTGSLSVGGNLTVSGDLTINGTTTTLNTATLDVEDKNITLNFGAGDTSASANGAGITIQDAVDASTDASMTWNTTNDQFVFSHPVKSSTTTTVASYDSLPEGVYGSANTSVGPSAKHHVIISYDNPASGGRVNQLFFPDDGGSPYFRARQGETVGWHGWKQFWSSDDFSNNSSNWDTAYGWGDHATAGYLTSGSFLPLSGGTLTGTLIVSQGSEVRLQAGSNEDIGDIVYNYFDGSEKHRLWDGGADGLNYRYNAGTAYKIGVNTNTNSLSINGTTVIDSSRNLNNLESVNLPYNKRVNFGDATSGLGYIKYGSYGTGTNLFTFGLSNGTTSNPNGVVLSLGGKSLLIADGLTNKITLDGSTGAINAVGGYQANGNTVWHAGNDGSGSGLDADLLDGQHASNFASSDDFKWRGTANLTSTTTSALKSELLARDVFDSSLSAFKTSWSYAGNGDLTDAGRFTEMAGTSWLTWTDNSTDNTQGNFTALAIAPNTGGSAGKVFIYNDQGSSYSPGWREVWTSTSDGSGSGLDADLLDGQHGSYYYPASNPNGYTANTGTVIEGGTDFTGTYPAVFRIAGNNIYSNGGITYTGSTDTLNLSAGNYSTTTSRNRFNTPSGYIELGPMNTTWAHIYTDRGNFYFNKGLYVLGNQVWHSGNDGSGSGLDADLLDGQQGSYYRPVSQSLYYKPTRESAGSYLDLNAATTPGIYRLHSAANHTGHPTGSGYGFAIVLDNSDVHGHILLDRLDGGTMHIRAKTGTTWTTSEWNKVWTSGNDGSGSGLDADTVDGYDSTRLTRAVTTVSGDWNSIFNTGTSYTTGIYQVQAITSGAHSNYPSGVYPYGGVLAWRMAHATFKLYAAHTGDLAYQTGWANDAYSGWRNLIHSSNIGSYAWTSSNDGSGSGLDADLLDGRQGSDYLRKYDDTYLKLFFVDHPNGPIWDTSIEIGKVSDFNAGTSAPTSTPGGSYGTLVKANSDGCFYGIEEYSAGNFRPLINWGDDTGDSPFRVAFNNSTRFQMDSSGNFTANGNVTAYSDRRLKDNIEQIPDALDKVGKMRGVTFTRNDQDDMECRYAGVIAQEVEAVFPEVVHYDEENDVKTVAYGNMVGLLIEAIKELKAEVDDLKLQLKEK